MVICAVLIASEIRDQAIVFGKLNIVGGMEVGTVSGIIVPFKRHGSCVMIGPIV